MASGPYYPMPIADDDDLSGFKGILCAVTIMIPIYAAIAMACLL